MPANFAAYLRVYEPLTAFDRERQLYWRRYVKEGRAVAPLDGPVRQRTAVVMHQLEDHTYNEVAARMDMSPEAAKSLLYRARNQLRECLAGFMS